MGWNSAWWRYAWNIALICILMIKQFTWQQRNETEKRSINASFALSTFFKNTISQSKTNHWYTKYRASFFLRQKLIHNNLRRIFGNQNQLIVWILRFLWKYAMSFRYILSNDSQETISCTIYRFLWRKECLWSSY